MHEKHLLKILFSAADTVFEKTVEKKSLPVGTTL
jgi:hypothetical protein